MRTLLRSLGSRVRQPREGWTQEARLAERSGLDRSDVGGIEGG